MNENDRMYLAYLQEGVAGHYADAMYCRQRAMSATGSALCCEYYRTEAIHQQELCALQSRQVRAACGIVEV